MRRFHDQLSIQTAAPLELDDLHEGDCWRSGEREVTRELVLQFAELTGDHDPLHVDEEFARDSAFRQPIAHGLLGLSLLAGLSSRCPLVKTIALTGIEHWEFKHPIFFGDVVYAETEVLRLEPHGRRAGKVTWFRRLLKQDGRIVQQGDLQTIVAARANGKSDVRAKTPVRSLASPLDQASL